MRYKNYINSHSKSNRIYSRDEVLDMPLRRIRDNKLELESQYRSIGVPTEEALRASSNVIWVDEYTRDDGTKVSGHWRSKPEGSTADVLTGGAANAGELSNSKMSDYITQENKKSVLRNDPESIAGVERGTPMSFEEAVGEDINPAYHQDDYQDDYVNNCQSCVLAYEARRRGYDVQSVERKVGSKAEELSNTTFGAWLDSDGKSCEGSVLSADNAETLNRQLDNMVRQGERYAIINFMIRDLDEECEIEGHIEVLDRDSKGNLRLYDPQSNRIRQEEGLLGHLDAYADFTDRLPSLILRIDDKKFNPYYLDEVVRGVRR